MNEYNSKSMRTLEFDKIIQMLTAKAVSPMGKELAAELVPTDDLSDVRLWQKETSEAVSMILRKGSLPLGGVKDIRQALKRVALGGMLSVEELISVSDFLYVCRKINSYSKSDGRSGTYELLQPQFDGVKTMQPLEREINRCIVNLEVADDASPKLNEIRRNIKVSNERIKDHLNSIIHSQAYKNMLQDTVITIRNDRYCVPVKQEYRSGFSGMIHDQSATGATVFIEPMGVVQLNNRIKELKAEERAEIEKILRELSYLVADNGADLSANIEILTHIDFVFAKGELSVSMHGTEPVFNTRGYINIKKGRHPLLNKETVVPTNIYLGGDFTTLLITGPNTGGKTVSLKTLGLFTLMGQAGLHISAFDNSELAVFDEVFADIGDEQSIEQNLSTFSSHMSNIVKILENVTSNSLVLLDELGAGTDPTEGAALAIAVLKHLLDRKIRTAVTTHYSELKVFALSTDGVENASCEFDVETLRPTYKLLIGIPGKSNAFAISKRLGLPESVISVARETLSREDARFEDVITDLEISKKTVIMEQERAEQYRREAESMKKEFESQKQKLNLQREKLIQEAKQEAQRMMQAAKDEADSMIRELQKQINSSASRKDIEETRQKIKDRTAEMGEALSNTDGVRVLKAAPESLAKGDKVYVHSINQSGTVVSAPDTDGNVTVQIGIMKIKSPLTELSLDESGERSSISARAASSSVKAGKSMFIKPEIDLRGFMVEEGIQAADKYLDDAYLAGLKQVTIIHGKGTGALRAAIQSHLKTHSHVGAYRLGKFGEGETGVTIVELK